MPDFATPPGVFSPAHAHLAAVIHDPVDESPLRPVTVTRLARHALPRVIVLDVVTPNRFESDRWWGRLSRNAVVLDKHGD